MRVGSAIILAAIAAILVFALFGARIAEEKILEPSGSDIQRMDPRNAEL